MNYSVLSGSVVENPQKQSKKVIPMKLWINDIDELIKYILENNASFKKGSLKIVESFIKSNSHDKLNEFFENCKKRLIDLGWDEDDDWSLQLECKNMVYDWILVNHGYGPLFSLNLCKRFVVANEKSEITGEELGSTVYLPFLLGLVCEWSEEKISSDKVIGVIGTVLDFWALIKEMTGNFDPTKGLSRFHSALNDKNVIATETLKKIQKEKDFKKKKDLVSIYNECHPTWVFTKHKGDLNAKEIEIERISREKKIDGKDIKGLANVLDINISDGEGVFDYNFLGYLPNLIMNFVCGQLEEYHVTAISFSKTIVLRQKAPPQLGFRIRVYISKENLKSKLMKLEEYLKDIYLEDYMNFIHKNYPSKKETYPSYWWNQDLH